MVYWHAFVMPLGCMVAPAVYGRLVCLGGARGKYCRTLQSGSADNLVPFDVKNARLGSPSSHPPPTLLSLTPSISRALPPSLAPSLPSCLALFLVVHHYCRSELSNSRGEVERMRSQLSEAMSEVSLKLTTSRAMRLTAGTSLSYFDGSCRSSGGTTMRPLSVSVRLSIAVGLQAFYHG